MSGWGVLSRFAVCGVGVVVFLKLVANAIEYSQTALSAFEKQERKAQERRREAAAELEAATEEAA